MKKLEQKPFCMTCKHKYSSRDEKPCKVCSGLSGKKNKFKWKKKNR